MAPDTVPSSPEKPQTIGRYRIVERLASGSGGEVYKAFDPMIERSVAIKLFRVTFDDKAVEAQVKQQFYREMQRVGSLVHHAIATLFDAGDVADGLFMASEFVDGSSLGALLTARPDLDLPRRVAFLSQVVAALDHARAHGMPHLNLKPTNILIGADNTVKVGGFGTARVLGVCAPVATGAVPWISRYTAPERVSGETGDERTDVFALAMIALEALGGELPQNASSADPSHPSEAAVSHLAQLGLDQAKWDTSFGRALDADPAARFPTVAAFWTAATNALGIARLDGSRRWTPPVPAAVAGMTPDQLRNLERIPTQTGTSRETRAADPQGPTIGGSESSGYVLAAAEDETTAFLESPRMPWRQPPSPAPPAVGRPAAVPIPPSGAVAAPPAAAPSVQPSQSSPATAPAPQAASASRSKKSWLLAAAAVLILVFLGGAAGIAFIWSRYSTRGVTVNQPVPPPIQSGTPNAAPPPPAPVKEPAPASPSPSAAASPSPAAGQPPAGAQPAPSSTATDAPVSPIAFELVTTRPRQISGTPAPAYPQSAIDANQQGTVEVSWVIDETGAVKNLEIHEATLPVFRTEVQTWLKSVRYTPGEVDGRRVKVQVHKRFKFELPRRP